MSKAPLSLPVRCALAIAAVALATALRLLVERLLGIQLPFVMEVLAAVAAAYYGGPGPGLLATVLGAAAVWYAFIRRVRESGERLPAVALTGYTRPNDRMRALWAGFQTHLSKPVDPAELLTVVASLVRANHL